MKRVKLDRIDQKILRTLQCDGRISNVDLAKQAGISAPPCLRRVRALEEAGYITGYHADLSPEKLGYNVMAYTHVSLTSHAEGDLAKFEEQVKAWPQVRECLMVSGDVDYILKVVAEDWDSYQQFVTHHLTKASFVASVRSTLVIRAAKSECGVPINDGNNGKK
ncbi:MAG: Lrp/AsnC family transcriptional regulator [Bdellovibrionales bacterium]